MSEKEYSISSNSVGNQNHFYWLDSLRFIAAFMVVISHSRNDFFMMYSDLPESQHNIFGFLFTLFGRLGHESVIIFFVLSGFLVGGRGIERISNGTFRIGSYVIDRFSRIYPPLIASIIFFFITTLFVPDQEWNTWRALGNLLNLQGICCESLVTPYWSLSYEVWFYIVLGALAVCFKTKNIKYFLLSVIAISVFMLGSMSFHYLFVWFVGALAYLTRPKKINKMILVISSFGIVAGIGLWQITKDTNAFQLPFNIKNYDLAEMPLTISISLFIQQIILIEPKNKIAISIDNFFSRMAKFSYSLYLSHRIVLMWVFYYFFTKESATYSMIDLLWYMIIVLVCLVVCWGQYMVSERYTPAIKNILKKKFNCK